MIGLVIEWTNFEIGTFLTCNLNIVKQIYFKIIIIIYNFIFKASLGEIQLGTISICQQYLYLGFQVKDFFENKHFFVETAIFLFFF